MVSIAAVRKAALRPTLPPVLDGVSLRVAAGETFGLCGPGAGGKSLLLKILCGLVRPEEGRVEIDGIDMHDRARAADHLRVRAAIGMLFQNNALFDSFSVLDNVAFPLRQQRARAGVADTDSGDRAAERLREVGLFDHRHKNPSQLSGGQRKRVALARALISEPRLILFDEPTAGLDPVTTSKIYDLLRAVRARTGATVLAVSSDVDALRAFAPRMGMLYRGQLCYDGPADAMADCDVPVVRQFVRGELEGPL